MRKTITLLFLLALQGSLFGQERYKVVYDFQSDNIFYYSLDETNKVVDTLEKPRFRKNSMVEIEVLNINPFAVVVETEVSEEDIHISSGSGFNFGSLLGGIGNFSSGGLNLNVGGLAISDTVFSRGARSRGDALSNKFADLNEVATNVDALKSTLLSNLRNPNLTKEEISENIRKVAAQQEDVRLPDPNANFYAYLSKLQLVAQTGKNEILTDIRMLKTDLDQATIGETPSRGQLMLRNSSYAELDNMVQSLEMATAETVTSIEEIESLYSALEGAAFSRTYDYFIEADKSSIELEFKESDFSSPGATGSSTVLKKKNIKIFSKGGFKINTGVALTMNNFGDSSHDFYINSEGSIASDARDYFIPNLSTMINFYPVISENFNLGGSFGLSIPISNNINGLNFLLGPSIFLGNESRLSLSGGVAYGPVDRLTDGLRQGEMTSLSSLDAYTETVYDLGYYLGISFSLFDLN